MKVDTQIFVLAFLLIAVSGFLAYAGLFVIAGIALILLVVDALFYFWHVNKTHTYSVFEMSLRDRDMKLKEVDTEKYWEIAKQRPDIVAGEGRKVGFTA